ncbi:uncharacterized protein NEMAJ01_1500 [Nematocida major]|uniref:uncharacterized protein n=1 Tax=Nematocida major TaxID=1912982 RepID=UPI002007A8CB|nr:uncharacterized protein NEMAJ01_1500 [Nematocida major]KAH9386604.1 hypothetical protein NEMAJ01_1500 [Nematocida major]
MLKKRQEGIACLEDILTLTEEILALSKITVDDREKDIHREVREAFQIKTKTELLILSISTLYNTIIDVESYRECSRLWKESQEISPKILQQQKNRDMLRQYLENMNMGNK